jgi:hypothetical protein
VSFGGNNSLETLDLYHTSTIGIVLNFTRLTNLITLTLSKNSITDNWFNESKRFKGLTRLQDIILSENHITTLPRNVFADNVKLRSLHLDQNMFDSWKGFESVFRNCNELEYLNLRQNQIQTFNESFVAALNNGKFRAKRLKVSLQGNPFLCDCSVLWFRKWLDSNSCFAVSNSTISTSSICVDDAEHLICHSPSKYENRQLMSISLIELTIFCLPWYYYVCAAVVICLILAMVSYRYRWYIRWSLYRCRHSKSELLSLAADSETSSLLQQRYDIYVSCELVDEQWAEEVANRIENNFITPRNNDHITVTMPSVSQGTTSSNRQPMVYFEGRATPGEPEFDQMTRAIYMSRTAIIGLSVEYLRDSKCQFELNLIGQAMAEKYAQAASDHIVLVALAESGAVMHLLPQYLRSHFASKSLSWSSTDVTQQEVFFSDLQRRLSTISSTNNT